MHVIRPARPEDADAVAALAARTPDRLTTLPTDRNVIAKRLARTAECFARQADRPGGEMYLLVLEDTDTRQLLGTAGVVSKTGGYEPFYSYELVNERYESKQLKVGKDVRSLHLVEDHDGPAEIGSLLLDAATRGKGLGRMMSMSRFLFMAGRPGAFEPAVVAEIRGVSDTRNVSPFWEAVGRVFFDVDFEHADALSLTEKRFIADLMPDHPIYVDMLSAAARDVVGKAHPNSMPARRLLEAEGFTFAGRVDIFDAGPMLACELPAIHTVAHAVTSVVSAVADGTSGPPTHLVCNDRWTFRAAPASIGQTDRGLTLPAEVCRAIEVEPGDAVRLAPLRLNARPTVDINTLDPFADARRVDSQHFVTTERR